MTKVAYTVSARHPTAESASRYSAWLAAGHVQAVLAGGAESAAVIALDASGDSATGSVPHRTVEVRYIFPSRAALDRYLTEHAPRLRAEGLALFGPGTGVTFARTVGEVAWVSPSHLV